MFVHLHLFSNPAYETTYEQTSSNAHLQEKVDTAMHRPPTWATSCRKRAPRPE